MPPTLQDVARTVGLHTSTVSLSLRGHPRIPASTRERVKAAARQLGYRIDPLVSALMQSRRRSRPSSQLTLGFLGPTNPATIQPSLSSGYLAGASRRASEFNFTVEPLDWAQAATEAAQFSNMLSRRRISGLLVTCPEPEHPLPHLEWERVSAVAIGPARTPPPLHHVTENFFDTVGEAIDRCRARGYRRIGFVRATLAVRPAADRMLAGYLLHQFRSAALALLPTGQGEPLASAAFARWLAAHRPEAILTDHPSAVLGWLQQLGTAVPADLGVVGLQGADAAPCSGYTFEPTTTGALAVETLLGLMHRRETGLPARPHQILLNGVWRDHGTLPVRPPVRRPAVR